MTDCTFDFDVAARDDLGTRTKQEDCLALQFSDDVQAGIAVLADGMGGHDDGDIASKFLVAGVAGELIHDIDGFRDMGPEMPERLEELTRFANEQLSNKIKRREADGTIGATLVAVVVVSDKVYWASVGDSPLFLFRDGQLRRLNADHSMSQQIDFMVEAGMISEAAAKNHPDRNVLTSAVRGKDVSKIDCPPDGFSLQADDILVLSSDGLNVLGSSGISSILSEWVETSGDDIADALIAAVRAHEADTRDNTSFAVVKLTKSQG